MTLFEKLIQRKVPMCFVHLLKHWYKEETMQIKWGKHLSETFRFSERFSTKTSFKPIWPIIWKWVPHLEVPRNWWQSLAQNRRQKVVN